MGNSSSKSKRDKGNGGDSLQSYPSFSRSDTQGSSRSMRSMRSRLSTASENGSYKSALDEPSTENAATPENSNTNNTTPEPKSTEEDNNKTGDDGYPFPDVSGGSPMVPKSMQQVEPKDPILIYRDREGNVTSELNNNNLSSPESSGFLTPGGGTGPPMSPGGRSMISQANGGPTLNVDEVIQRLLDAGYSGKATRSVCLKNSEIATICQVSREIFLSQPTLLELSPPVKIVGDVHGQYGDLIRLFEMCGFPPAANYLFLGDYVDRGKQSLETVLLLLCYKIKYPENFFLLRGNHECANVTRVYGFYDECKRRCNIKTWKTFIDTFNALPITAVVAHKIFCVHGGLSPSLNNLNEIRNIERPTDVPDYGLLNDLLWSDPADTVNEWEDNERGVSYCYNKVAINRFLTKFGFDLVCRAHMVVEDGYEFFNDRALVTVFSAPNYCGEFDNWGAVMSVSEELLCSFELLKPLDSAALKQEMRKGKHERRNMMMHSPAQSPGV